MRGTLLVVLLLVRPVAAQAPCDPKEAAELRAHLEHEQHRAARWRLIWGSIFGASVASSLALGYFGPEERRVASYVGAGKASIGVAGHLFTPLRIPVPAPNADACADLAALREALKVAAKRERSTFLLNHAGAIVVNAAGALIIWKYATGTDAIVSVALGYPIGLLSNYLAPRGSWHYYRERTWTAVALPHEHGWTLGVAGAF